MSYILEALKKSDAERKRGEVPSLDTTPHTPASAPEGKSRLPWILAIIFGLAAIALAGVLLLRPELLHQADTPAPTPAAQKPAPTPAAQKPATPESFTTETAATKPVVPEPLAPKPAPLVAAEAEPEPQPMPEPEPQSMADAEPEPILEPEPEPAPVPDVPELVAQPEPPAQPLPIAEPEPEVVTPEPEAPEAPETIVVLKPEPPAAPAPEPAPEPQPAAKVAAAPEVKPEPNPVTIHVPTPDPAPAPPLASVDTPAPPPAVKSQRPTVIVTPRSAPKAVKKSHESAKDHVDRAWSSIDMGLYNQALRDLNRAVEIEPNFADAWFARGWANEKSGNELSAIGDYARAIAAKPDYAFALFSRGYLNLYVGSVRAAVTDFVRTQGVAKDDSLRQYSHLWLYLSRSRADQPALARLREDAINENLAAWPGPLVNHFLGQIEEGRVLAAIEGGDQAHLIERRCTGYFFLGISALLNGDKPRARNYFEKTLATGAVQFRQYDAAKRELDSLNR